MAKYVITLFGEPEVTDSGKIVLEVIVDGKPVSLRSAWPFLAVLILWSWSRPIQMQDLLDQLPRPVNSPEVDLADATSRFRKHKQIVRALLDLKSPKSRALSDFVQSIWEEISREEISVDVVDFDRMIVSTDSQEVRKAIALRQRGPLLMGWKEPNIVLEGRELREKKYQEALQQLKENQDASPEEATSSVDFLVDKPGAADVDPSPPAHNLPSSVTSFVGRERERQDIRNLLLSGRLVTLTGMGGCGKTRLAVQTARELLGDWDAVRLVELAALTSSDQVPQAVATALGVAEQKGVTVTEALIAFLQGRRTLLLLDNCEHLLLDDPSEADDCGTFVARLLHACPDLSVLATSRKPLNIDGECLCPVSPLPCPAPDFLPPDAPDPVAALLAYDAAQLFVDRALQFRRFTPGPGNVGPVAAICAALDGIPLALELAAARVKALPLERIAEVLSDRFGLLTNGRRESPARHKTLRAVIDWSYDLLDTKEQGLFCRLSVFAGGWTLDAAEAVGSSEELPCADVLNLLESLVDKSLVIADLTASPGRYRMLETVRQYATDRLRDRGEWGATRQRHRNFFNQFSKEAKPQLHGPNQVQWLARVEAEHDNLRTALRCYHEYADGDDEWLLMVAALWWFWWIRGHATEGRSHIELALLNAKDASADARSRALEGAGVLATFQGDYQIAEALLAEGYTIAEQLEKKAGMSCALQNLGIVADRQGNHSKAQDYITQALQLQRELENKEQIAGLLQDLGIVLESQHEFEEAQGNYRESLAIRREIGDTLGIANSLKGLGQSAFDRGEYDHAQKSFSESFALHVQLGNKRGIASLHLKLGGLARATRDYEVAGKNFEDGLALFRIINDKSGTADAITQLAALACDEGRYEDAERLYKESLSLLKGLGDKENVAEVLIILGNVTRQQCKYGEARRWMWEGLGVARNLEDHLSLALLLEELAFLSAAEGQPTQAGHLLGTAGVMIEQFRYCRPHHMIARYDLDVSAVREVLGAEAFAAALAEGRAMSWEQAVAFALGEDAP